MWREALPIVLIINCYCQPVEKSLSSMLKVLHETGDSDAIAYLNKLVDEVRSKNATNINIIPNDTIQLVNKTQEFQIDNGTTSLRAVLQKNIEIVKDQNGTDNNVTTVTTDLKTRSAFTLDDTNHPITQTRTPLNNTDAIDNPRKANNNIIVHVPIYIDLKGVIDKVQTEKKDSDKAAETNVYYQAYDKSESDEIHLSKEVDIFNEIYKNIALGNNNEIQKNNAVDNNNQIQKVNAVDNKKETQESDEVDKYKKGATDTINYKVRVFAFVPEKIEDQNSVEYINLRGKKNPKEYFSFNNLYKPKWQKGMNFIDDKNDNRHLNNEMRNPLTKFKKNKRNKQFKSDSFDALSNTFDGLSDEKIAELIRKVLRLSKHHRGLTETN